MQEKTRVIIVLGTMLQKDGTVSEDFQERMRLGVGQVREGERWLNVVIISGGQTRAQYRPEAEVARSYLVDYLRSVNLEHVVWVWTEGFSRTTPENIVFSQLLLMLGDIVPDELVIVGREGQIPKTVVIVSKVWEFGSPTKIFVAGSDPASPFMRFVDSVLFTALSYVDPHGTSFVYRLLKKMRNG